MNFISLFTGIGMMDLGLELAGMKCVCQVECDPYKLKILKLRWPDVIRFEKIERFRCGDVGAVELICAGYPCQGESYSGKRKGSDDDRWYWPEVLRIIKVKRPAVFFGENVIGHITMGLPTVINDLENAGYSVRVFDIPSAACELSTVERHVWVIAEANEKRLQGNVEVSFPWLTELKGEFSRSSSKQRERWALPSARVCRVGEGGSNWMDRLKSIGDSIPPQVVEIIGRAILEVERNYK